MPPRSRKLPSLASTAMPNIGLGVPVALASTRWNRVLPLHLPVTRVFRPPTLEEEAPFQALALELSKNAHNSANVIGPSFVVS